MQIVCNNGFTNSWDDHVFNVSKETTKCLGFLKRRKKYFTPPIYALSMLPTLDRKVNTIRTYEQVRLKAHLISWIVYKIER